MLWDSVYQIYCINLYERKDRYEHVKEQFRKIGILDKVQFIQSHRDPRGGDVGLYDNYMNIFRISLEDMHTCTERPIIIFEDDVRFNDDRMHLVNIIEDFIPLHDSWDTIRLGYWKGVFIEEIVPNMLYRGNCFATHAVIISPNFMRKMLSANMGSLKHIDRCFSKVSGRHLLPKCSICYQAGLASDILWGEKDQQALYLRDALSFQIGFEKKTSYIWTRIGKHIPGKKLRGFIQYVYIMGFGNVLRHGVAYRFSNKVYI